MADIMIRGMEMPTKGEYPATLFVCSDGSAYLDFWTFPTETDKFDLIALPEGHGRLVDADALNKLIDKSYSMTDRVDVHNGYAICQELIKELPTVVPAEKEDT